MFKIVTIPFDRNKKGFDEEVLTKFVLNKQVTSYHVHFFEDGAEKYWSVFLEYDPVLEKAPEKDGAPVYIIGTNKELVNWELS